MSFLTYLNQVKIIHPTLINRKKDDDLISPKIMIGSL